MKTQANTEPRMLTKCGIERASKILGKSRAAVYQQVWRKEIPHRKRGRHVYFFEEELQRWLDSAPGVRPEDLEGKQR